MVGCGEFGFKDGPLNLAKFYYPWGITVNPNNNYLYVSEFRNHCIREITDQGIKSEISQFVNVPKWN